MWILDKPRLRFHHIGVFPKSVLFSVTVLLSMSSVVAQNTAPPVDAAALLKELQNIQTTQKQAKTGQLSHMAQQLQDATRTDGDTGRLYVDAVRTVDFSSQMGDAKRFQDWRARKKDFLDNKAFQAALRFHVRYLALTLTAAANANTATPAALSGYHRLRGRRGPRHGIFFGGRA